MRALLALALLAPRLIAPACGAGSDAQSFPNRPVKIVVPFPAGGPTDVNMRIVGQKLAEIWGQGVVIENRPGANTGIGAQVVAKSPADGYTLLAAMDTTLVMNPATGASMNYDPFKDFAAITLTAKNTSLLTVRASDGPKTIQELIARGKASATKLNYGAGITITRLAGATFAKAAGIDVQLIPYKGSAEVVQGLLTGSVDFIVDGIAPSLPLIQSGQFRPLAKLNNRRAAAAARAEAACGGLGPADRRDVELDRPRRAGRHAAGDRAEDPRRCGARHGRRRRRRPAGEGRHPGR